jgi:hypothetical protein
MQGAKTCKISTSHVTPSSAAVQAALDTQEEIGKYAFFRGHVSVKWREAYISMVPPSR